MIGYSYLCQQRHRFGAQLDSMFDPDPACPTCGSLARRMPANPRLSGSADAGPSREQMPKSWQAVRGAHPDVVTGWRGVIEKREKLEEKYPELAGDRRPVLAHEGIFRNRPLRAGDDIESSVQTALADSATTEATAQASRPGSTSPNPTGRQNRRATPRRSET